MKITTFILFDYIFVQMVDEGGHVAYYMVDIIKKHFEPLSTDEYDSASKTNNFINNYKRGPIS